MSPERAPSSWPLEGGRGAVVLSGEDVDADGVEDEPGDRGKDREDQRDQGDRGPQGADHLKIPEVDRDSEAEGAAVGEALEDAAEVDRAAQVDGLQIPRRAER